MLCYISWRKRTEIRVQLYPGLWFTRIYIFYTPHVQKSSKKLSKVIRYAFMGTRFCAKCILFITASTATAAEADSSTKKGATIYMHLRSHTLDACRLGTHKCLCHCRLHKSAPSCVHIKILFHICYIQSLAQLAITCFMNLMKDATDRHKYNKKVHRQKASQELTHAAMQQNEDANKI